MSGAAVYVLRLVCAACICALVRAMGGKGTGSGLRSLLAGAFLVLTALDPKAELKLPQLDPEGILQEAEEASMSGARQAKQEQEAIISGAFESYIWNKANALGVEAAVQVELDEQLLPCAAVITGALTEQEREALGRVLASELGLGEEEQTWITPHQSSGSQP